MRTMDMVPTIVTDQDVEHFLFLASSPESVRELLENIVEHFDDQRVEREILRTMRHHHLRHICTLTQPKASNFGSVPSLTRTNPSASFREVVHHDILILWDTKVQNEQLYLQCFRDVDPENDMFLDEHGGCWTEQTLKSVLKFGTFRLEHFAIWR